MMDDCVNWKLIDTATKIEAIRSVWFLGCSASQIAKNFQGATRNAIIGAYNRYGKKQLADKPLRSHATGIADKKFKNQRASATFLFAKPLPPKPMPAPREVAFEVRLCGKPLLMLEAKECKWPINSAEADEIHLFCALPADGPYCSHHKQRAVHAQKAA